jgi:ABC-type glycerol-3-phosphate transport system permease component
MIENKGIGSKIFDVINVVILVLITLICILPVWYVLCVSLSSREAVNAGQVALWDSISCHIRRSWGRVISLVPFSYLSSELC